jgi:mannose/fructose/N-acetylgalactosamine-specific phosphotransferase system component IIC
MDPVMLGGVSLVLLLLLGGWVALDAVALGQFMVSRPLVAGTLGGLVAGDPSTGVLAGVLLEALHVAHVPAGGASLPEPGPGAVVAGSVAVLAGAGGGAAGGLALGVTIGVVLGLLGGFVVARHRDATARRVERTLARGGTAGEVLARTLALDAARGVVFVAAGLALAVAVPVEIVAAWPFDLGWTVAFLALPGLLGVGAVGKIPVPRGTSGSLLMVGGAAMGAAATILAGVAAGLVGGGG